MNQAKEKQHFRKKKTIREMIEKELRKVTENGTTCGEEMAAALVREARNGNVKAFLAVLQATGEKPSDKLEVVEAPQNIKVEFVSPEVQQLINNIHDTGKAANQ